MRQFVHDNHGWLARQDCVYVHLVENRSLVFEFARRNSIKLGSQFRGSLASVTLNHSRDHVLAATGSANGFAQHVVRLANARSIAEKKLEDASRLFWGDFVEPLLWCLSHRSYCLSQRRNCHVRRVASIVQCGSESRASNASHSLLLRGSRDRGDHGDRLPAARQSHYR